MVHTWGCDIHKIDILSNGKSLRYVQEFLIVKDLFRTIFHQETPYPKLFWSK